MLHSASPGVAEDGAGHRKHLGRRPTVKKAPKRDRSEARKLSSAKYLEDGLPLRQTNKPPDSRLSADEISWIIRNRKQSEARRQAVRKLHKQRSRELRQRRRRPRPKVRLPKPRKYFSSRLGG